MSLNAVRREIRKRATAKRAASNAWFFKTGPGEYGEGDRFLGVGLSDLRTIVRTHQDLPLSAVERLLKSPWHEERLLALLVLVRQYGQGDARARDAIYRFYIGNLRRIDNWDLVDCSAAQILGAHLESGDRRLLRRLARSKSLWERRIAIIATYHYIRRGDFRDALSIAESLVDDDHDLIHKAVGWMLREIGKRDRACEERFLRAHGRTMPRTMLRYAIEKFPQRLRRRYLRRA